MAPEGSRFHVEHCVIVPISSNTTPISPPARPSVRRPGVQPFVHQNLLYSALQNGPAFQQSTAEFALAENNQPGDLVGALAYNDADASDAHRRGARAELLAAEGAREQFEARVDPDAARVELLARTRFDRETRDQYDLRVRIYDPTLCPATAAATPTAEAGAQSQAESVAAAAGNTNGGSASRKCGSEIRVVVRITDLNDNAPQLVVQNVTLPEGPVSSALLLGLNGTDADEAGTPNSQLSYGFLDADGQRIVSSSVRSFNPTRGGASGASSSSRADRGRSDGSIQVSMHPYGSGRIYLETGSLDRELEDTHCVRVFVQDRGEYPPGPLASNKTLCLFVEDVNGAHHELFHPRLLIHWSLLELGKIFPMILKNMIFHIPDQNAILCFNILF